MTTTPFCNTRLCLVMNVERCIPEVELCDAEKYCDDGTDEISELFPGAPPCQVTGMNNDCIRKSTHRPSECFH